MSDVSLNLRRFFRSTGKTLILPVDHGTAIAVPGLEKPRQLISDLNPYYDGYVVNYGLGRIAKKELRGKGVCFRTDVYKPHVPGNPNRGAYRLYGAEEALRVGAHAVMNMFYPHHPEEDIIYHDCASLIGECHKAGLPVILEALPFGLGLGHLYTPENISFAVRAACELGADVVKTAYPGDKEAFRQIVSESYVPVIVLGGASGGDETQFLQMVHDAIDAGAAGIAIGRNVWQFPRPAKMARALHDIVHTKSSVDLASFIISQ
jgi:DhnA family fructose-bisphosphate aldolase class Ia